MPSTLPPAEGPTAHTSTEQWQSFEMRMRQRRIERLLLRADAALDTGSPEVAREALEEVEGLDPLAPGVTERWARLSEPVAQAPPLDLDLRPADEVLQEPRRRSIWMGRAAAALLALGAIAWFAIPRELAPPKSAEALHPLGQPSVETQPAVSAPYPAAPPLPPVEVAVQDVAPTDTVAEPPLTEPPQQAQATSGTDLVSAPAAENARPMRADPPPASDLLPVEARRPDAAIRPDAARTDPGNRTDAAGGTEPALPPAVPIAAESSLERAPASAVPAPPPVPVVAPPTPAPSADTNAALPPAAAEEDEIRSTLAQYESAYSRLDVDAAGAVWPGLDRRALARAFDGLASQRVNLGSCDVRIISDTAAAECSGSATWTPKVGGGSHSQQRRWQFQLRNAGGDWQIVTARVR